MPELTFGPVPSRRLGRSVGINAVAPKVCTYSCAYCQLGRRLQLRTKREAFYKPDQVARAVEQRVQQASRIGEPIDYLTFVADGEPTLDLHLGATIRLLRPLQIPVAVITNGSLLSSATLREELLAADWISLKVDTVRQSSWRRVNRPHGELSLPAILQGMHKLAESFQGVLVTETMLLDGINDSEAEIQQTAEYALELKPRTAYLSVPTRPPAEPWALPPGEASLTRAYEIFRAHLPDVELLLGYEGDQFTSTGDMRQDLLGILSVHPMREAAVKQLFQRAAANWDIVADLQREGQITAVQYGPHRYFIRTVPRRAGRGHSKT